MKQGLRQAEKKGKNKGTKVTHKAENSGEKKQQL